ncbi:archaellar assembly protein FlaJ [Methanosarcina mazei]|jgi:flagellar protein FlaJ|uniref:Flagella-related protein FlaJ n=1 Tax=Methanosarcina mazei S-6 TaxID=213585 RepID=A0A0E3RHZ8_METMZ|nr:archaellar assembly protein FlaJ [Methanosarcina mazei]AKB64088.1 Flagella-related protein FlaJ [Methanosarcina mazei S-6]TAH67025.1 MAG: archaellar assembly protein FlaJ [Methanosarcina mazei]
MNYAEMAPYLKINSAKRGVEGYFSLARKLKSTKVVERVNDDMLFLLTYMAAISTADIERDRIFDYAGRQKEYEASKYFWQIHILASKWGYEYAKACKYISQKLKDAYLSKLFGRMANILSSGEPEKNFLKQEKITREEIYSNAYERSIESLKKWTDGYTALMVSVTLVVTIILVSVMIYNIENIETIAFLIVLLTLFICGLALYIIYKAAPAEKKLHALSRKSREQERIKFLSRVLLPLGAFSLTVLILLGTRKEYILLGVPFFTLPIGVLAVADDRKIDERDSSFPAFIKTLGTLAGTTGITIRSAMENLDRETIGCLKPGVEELHKGLSMGFKSRLCWEKFIGETGSELINRSSRIFNDAVELGGDPAEIGNIVSASSLAIVLLRMKRQLVSSGFKGLALTLHAVMVGLLIFVMEIISRFSGLVSKMSEAYMSAEGSMNGMSGMGMSMFNVAESVPLLYKFTFSVIIILTISNTLVVKIVEGGGNYKLLFYGGLMSGISGLCMILIPPVVSRVFTFQI